MLAEVVRAGWLKRGLAFPLPDGPHLVEYDGTGLGSERVIVDGVEHRRRSWYWFVPRFEFDVGRWRGVFEVRVWPWLAVRSLVLSVEGRVIYEEGRISTGARDRATTSF